MNRATLFSNEAVVPSTPPPEWVCEELVKTWGFPPVRVRRMGAREAFGTLYGCRERSAKLRATRESRRFELRATRESRRFELRAKLAEQQPADLTEAELHDLINESLSHLDIGKLVRVAKGLAQLI